MDLHWDSTQNGFNQDAFGESSQGQSWDVTWRFMKIDCTHSVGLNEMNVFRGYGCVLCLFVYCNDILCLFCLFWKLVTELSGVHLLLLLLLEHG